jgi:S-DNA-T family DNA segregation ATPase FtsK/SpoIIIE
MSSTLHFQADRIELVLASHKVPARVTGGRVTPRLVRYQVSTPLGVKVKQVANLAEEIALSLGAPSCRVFRQQGQVQVEVPRHDAQVVLLLRLARKLVALSADGRPAVPPLTAILGLDHGGMPLLLRLPSPDVAHVLIAGTTGSGKTALARSIIASLALHNSQRGLQLVLIDPKGRGFLPFQHLPHLLAPVISHLEEALLVLQRLVQEMERRDAEGRCDPRIVVAIDELADLVLCGGREMERCLTRLTQRGREAGIHLIACSQKPTAAVIGGLVKSNFPVRLVGSVASPEDAKVASGLAGTGAERLLGQGDFLLIAKGQVTRLQAAYISVSEIQALVNRLRQGENPLATALLPDRVVEDTPTDPIGRTTRLRSRLKPRGQMAAERALG